MSEPLRVVAFLEAATVTGPAKNLMRFCRLVREAEGSRRIEMSLATFVRGGGRNPFLDACDGMGIPVDVVREQGRFDTGVIEGMREVLRRRKADILQTHAVKSGFLARLGGLGEMARWVAFHHGYTAEDFKVKLYNQLNRWTLRGARCVVTVCQPFAAALEQTGVDAGRITVLPNAIEPFQHPGQEVVGRLRGQWAIGGECVLLCVGRLSGEKGHGYLLEALGQLGREDWKLVLVGDGPERKRLEAMAAGLGGRVIFAGQQKDVSGYFAAADVFVLPSLSEGSPNVVLEAMAAGLPVVGTAVGGVPETVGDGGVALLSAARDAAAMADHIRLVMQDSEVRGRMGEAGLERVKEFSVAAYERRLRAIYSRVMS